MMNKIVISASLDVKDECSDNQDFDPTKEESADEEDPSLFSESEVPDVPNKGKLQLDATVCDAYIKYPTDLNLLNEGREKAEELLDKLVKALNIKQKPRTYRRVARKDYLNIAKKKNKSKSLIRGRNTTTVGVFETGHESHTQHIEQQQIVDKPIVEKRKGLLGNHTGTLSTTRADVPHPNEPH